MITVYKCEDARQLYLYEMFKELGIDVNYSNTELRGILILPVSNYDIKNMDLRNVELVFCGIKTDELLNTNKIIISYLSEDFLIDNAKLTAIGLYNLIHDLIKETFNEKDVLLLGYGRCGKAMANLLSNNKHKFSIYTTNLEEQKQIKLNDFNLVTDIYPADIIINTIPYKVLNDKNLYLFKRENIIIDIASHPGGVDKDVANAFNLKVNHLLNIPGRVLPKSAAKLIYDEIIRIFKEKNI